MPEHIFVLFIGRTGSTYLMQTFDTLNECRVLCAYGEIFTSIEAIMRTFHADTKLNIIPEMYKSYALDNPYEYIQFIDENVPDKYLFSKIQIPYLIQKHDDLIKKILSYKNCKLIIVKRNLLDSYISEKKAEMANKWSKVDTTDMKITINPEEYVKYYSRINSAYIKIINIIKSLNKEYLIINYDDIHKNNINDREKTNIIISKLKTINLNLEINNTKYEKMEFLFLQDKNKDICEKISNYDELKSYLDDKKLNYLY